MVSRPWDCSPLRPQIDRLGDLLCICKSCGYTVLTLAIPRVFGALEAKGDDDREVLRQFVVSFREIADSPALSFPLVPTAT